MCGEQRGLLRGVVEALWREEETRAHRDAGRTESEERGDVGTVCDAAGGDDGRAVREGAQNFGDERENWRRRSAAMPARLDS